MKNSGAGRVTRIRFIFLLFPLISFLASSAGCLNLQKPARQVEQYTLEYAAPQFVETPLPEVTLKVERFTEAAVFNTSAMIYRSGPFKLDSYRYHRWRVHPADLIGGHLIRDLRKSALFKAVFSHLDPQEGGFILEGSVEEFLEIEEQSRRLAVLAVNATLLDSSVKNLPERILFQKQYRFQELLEEKTPRGLAESLSRAMRKFSEALIRDTHEAIRRHKP